MGVYTIQPGAGLLVVEKMTYSSSALAEVPPSSKVVENHSQISSPEKGLVVDQTCQDSWLKLLYT